MYQDKKVSSDSSDSGYDSLEGSLDTGNNKARLSIFTLGDYCIHILDLQSAGSSPNLTHTKLSARDAIMII